MSRSPAVAVHTQLALMIDSHRQTKNIYGDRTAGKDAPEYLHQTDRYIYLVLRFIECKRFLCKRLIKKTKYKIKKLSYLEKISS